MQHHAAPSSDGFKIWGPKSPSKKQGPVENPISLHSKSLKATGDFQLNLLSSTATVDALS
jgi:hypothetical protein